MRHMIAELFTHPFWIVRNEEIAKEKQSECLLRFQACSWLYRLMFTNWI